MKTTRTDGAVRTSTGGTVRWSRGDRIAAPLWIVLLAWTCVARGGDRVIAPPRPTWMIPALSHYGIWVPCAIDQPLPLARPGDTARFTLDGIDVQAISAPGHSFDSVVYVMDLAGKRVIFTGDIGFHGSGHILDRCWNDVPKARTVMRIMREQVLPLRPDIMIGGHHADRNPVEYWQNILRASDEAMHRAEAKGR